jgi:uncharacterized protein (TIGR00255 family)
VSARLPVSGPLNPIEVLRWPGVVREAAIDTAPLMAQALELLEQALDELLQSREREGEQIRQQLLQRCDAMDELVLQARSRLPQIQQALREKLQARLADLDTDADPGRLEQELVIQIQKSDEPVGRRLDFLMQELNREANTLGSKSVAIDTTSISVELKVLIEQMREQVQNTE